MGSKMENPTFARLCALGLPRPDTSVSVSQRKFPAPKPSHTGAQIAEQRKHTRPPPAALSGSALGPVQFTIARKWTDAGWIWQPQLGWWHGRPRGSRRCCCCGMPKRLMNLWEQVRNGLRHPCRIADVATYFTCYLISQDLMLVKLSFKYPDEVCKTTLCWVKRKTLQ